MPDDEAIAHDGLAAERRQPALSEAQFAQLLMIRVDRDGLRPHWRQR